MWQALIGPIAKVVEKGLDIVDDLVPDKDLAEKLKTEIKSKIMELVHTELIVTINAQKDIILGEVQGQSWFQRNWRPVLMLTIVAIVANNYLLYPYLSLFWAQAPVLELPDHLYSLMKIGVGGYIVGRSAEKTVQYWKQ